MVWKWEIVDVSGSWQHERDCRGNVGPGQRRLNNMIRSGSEKSNGSTKENGRAGVSNLCRRNVWWEEEE